jgi:hypothetical protein
MFVRAGYSRAVFLRRTYQLAAHLPGLHMLTKSHNSRHHPACAKLFQAEPLSYPKALFLATLAAHRSGPWQRWQVWRAKRSTNLFVCPLVAALPHEPAK